MLQQTLALNTIKQNAINKRNNKKQCNNNKHNNKKNVTTKKHNQTNRNNIKIIIMEDRAYFEPRAQISL